MTIQHLFSKFNSAINWNGFFYLFYKCGFTLRSFALYGLLTTQDFSLWANLNSIIFLLLLWIDCGLRKSVPRYLPEVEKDRNAAYLFIRSIITFQLVLLCLSIPLFIYAIKIFIAPSLLTNHTAIIPLATAIFLIEGLIAIVRTTYHAHFWNKQFNLLATALLTIEITADLATIYLIKGGPSNAILWYMLIIQCIVNGLLITTSLIMLIQLYKKTAITQETVDIVSIRRAFIKHSAIMWMNNGLKSISERNFLVPLITYAIGPAQANLFKIANDSALVFYRTVIKTVGTSDTSLLAYIELSEHKNQIAVACTKIITKVAGLSIPLLGIIFLFTVKGDYPFNNLFVFQSFIIMSIGYLLEALFLPYERVLEVKRHYTHLSIAYIPYICILVCLMGAIIKSSIGLLMVIVTIHLVRLVSLSCMIYFARSHYNINFPFSFVFKLSSLLVLVVAGISTVFYFLTHSFSL